ncbi:H-2 class II histocompatibility antigen, A-U alpha chain [Carassius auratus]|uniref:H-2 class II histocompatibility antigen, A-U alpha chain n=1 Tax=Carassius auratus TaxID=7957 RepID=A0A6P6LAX5_CARAU|nr:H-2 class II histocompatibility antigen, A-U alpha chain-like [Carassius auratus]
MELRLFLLSITAVLSTESKIYKAHHLVGCSATEREDMYGLDGEEIFYYDFNKNKTVVAVPEFADSDSFPTDFEPCVHSTKMCKDFLALFTNNNEHQAEQADPPQTSIYPRTDVVVGAENTLICHVTGFFPPPVRVFWSKNSVNVTENITLSQYRPSSDGTYDLFSTLKIIPLEGETDSCTVNHKSLQQPQTNIWDVEAVLPGIGPSVFCGVGLTLGLLGVLTGAYFCIKAHTNTLNMEANNQILDTI